MSDTYITNGFKDTPIGPSPVDWDIVPLGRLGLQFFGGGTPSRRKPEYWGGAIPWTTSAHLSENVYFDKYADMITEAGLAGSSSSVVPAGNLLIGTRVGVGKVAIATEDIAISQDLTGMIVDRSQVDPEYLVYAIRWGKTQKAFSSGKRGSTIKGIPRADLVQILVPLPPLDEQRKIAHVLNTLQAEITAQDDIIAAAKETKRSLMARLFTYGPGPEPAPTKETEIGEVPEHWEVVEIGEVIEGTQYGLSQRAYPKGMYPILGMGHLAEGYVRPSNLVYVDLDIATFEKFRLGQGDILFNRTNSHELVGKTAIFDLEGDFVFASYLVRVVTDSEQLRPEYLTYYLNTDAAQRHLKMIATRAVSQSNISATKLRGFEIPRPSPNEQREIAEVLTQIDRKVAAERDRRAAMQDLFQSTLHELMSGRVRLNRTEL